MKVQGLPLGDVAAHAVVGSQGNDFTRNSPPGPSSPECGNAHPADPDDEFFFTKRTQMMDCKPRNTNRLRNTRCLHATKRTQMLAFASFVCFLVRCRPLPHGVVVPALPSGNRRRTTTFAKRTQMTNCKSLNGNRLRNKRYRHTTKRTQMFGTFHVNQLNTQRDTKEFLTG